MRAQREEKQVWCVGGKESKDGEAGAVISTIKKSGRF